MSTTAEPADHRGERPETEGPLTEADHQVQPRLDRTGPRGRCVPGRGLHRASTWTTLGTTRARAGYRATSRDTQP